MKILIGFAVGHWMNTTRFCFTITCTPVKPSQKMSTDLAIMVREIQPGDRQTNKQRRFGNQVTFLPFG